MTPARFYIGEVGHQRFGHAAHTLRYKIAYLFLDLDRIPEANRLSNLLGVGTGGCLSFRARDHGDGTSDDLANWVRTFLLKIGCKQQATRIEILTLPRMFGYVFNPLTVYFIRDHQGRLHHVLYQVSNTFGERHFYLCAADGDGDVVPLEHKCEKAFYVSPFFDVAGSYHFKLVPPREETSVHIRYDDETGTRVLTAHLRGKAHEITDAKCLELLVQFPLMTVGVVAGIHWEALKLWIKGAKYRSRPPLSKPSDMTTTYTERSESKDQAA